MLVAKMNPQLPAAILSLTGPCTLSALRGEDHFDNSEFLCQ